ncbi:adenylyltransferase and sulfurtransferase [Geosmithia morbida]|uniref:Adenylyltransferase and sulfurtransferase uba4 n=1 Tax=Geosmithia morbida TaxID=1094350 RepID=A0A9P5D5A1_9HYPO|nr:adenylyltransferase and sulfurtransferase [Geosmithia morbida]KAF4126977.1 adenylyltransferase and sulfurtransferase [Geosmithia morbida]
MDRITHLQREIAQREAELADLKAQLALAESQERLSDEHEDEASGWKWPLSRREYDRYSRQMVVPKFGLQGQLKLRKTRVLLVGAGGLGCPAAAYLAGSGVGKIGIVDGDVVDTSNLHRQICHSTGRVGTSKVDSVITFLKELNPDIAYRAHHGHLTTLNARDIVSGYDVVLDCTDHPASRYLVSDICVLLGRPLVSASALQTSGQLMRLNDGPGRGPCYRCVFPRPPPPESVVGCGEGGILGPVVGVMGVLQALEAIKLIVADGGPPPAPPTMLIFSAADPATPFRSVRMRGRRRDCFACGDDARLTLGSLETSMDYVRFCGVRAPVRLLAPEERVSPEEYVVAAARGGHVLIDVRDREPFTLGSIDGSINIPIGRFTSHRVAEGEDAGKLPEWWPADAVPPGAPIYLVCRVGNDSQIAARKLKDLGLDRGGRFIGDIRGGLQAWRETVDPTMPST